MDLQLDGFSIQNVIEGWFCTRTLSPGAPRAT